MKIWTTLLSGRIGMRGTLCLPTLIVLVAFLCAALMGAACNHLSAAKSLAADAVIATPALHAPGDHVDGLRRIRYLSRYLPQGDPSYA